MQLIFSINSKSIKEIFSQVITEELEAVYPLCHISLWENNLICFCWKEKTKTNELLQQTVQLNKSYEQKSNTETNGRLSCGSPRLVELGIFGALTKLKSAANDFPYTSQVALGLFGQCNAQASKVAHYDLFSIFLLLFSLFFFFCFSLFLAST